ncbi:MAG: murein biosynthesis integral membrane protein MurJ [Peptococcaceae bacterium]|nr:murein biosynthesis integral membrane protein MurJ [Peptococcaceae bacterium]
MAKKQDLLQTTILLSAVSVLSKLLGFVREQVIAWRFGAGAAVDSYVAALLVPQLLAGIVGGALSTAFLPVYSEDKSAEGGRRLAVTTSFVNALLGIAGSLAAYAFAPLIVRVLVGNFPPEQQLITAELLRIMSFGTLLINISFFLTILFNSHGGFLLPALNPIIQNIAIVAGLIVLGAQGIAGLAWSTMLGMAIPLLLLVFWALYKNYPLIGRPNLLDPKFKRVIYLSLPIFVAGIFGQLYMVVDRRLASGLDAGSIASLSFANRLVQLPAGIFVMALATALYPTLANLAALGDKKGFAKVTIASLRSLVVLLVPATVGLWVLRYPIVRLAFERGSFDATDTNKTAFALGFYALGLLGLSAGQVLSRAFFSLHDTITPVKIGIVTALLNILLALILVYPLAHGGLALANSISVSLSAVFNFMVLRRKLGPVPMGMLPLLVKVGIVSLGMGAVSSVVYGATIMLGEVMALGLAVVMGLLAYGGGLLAMRVEEAIWGLARLRTQLTRLRK